MSRLWFVPRGRSLACLAILLECSLIQSLKKSPAILVKQRLCLVSKLRAWTQGTLHSNHLLMVKSLWVIVTLRVCFLASWRLKRVFSIVRIVNKIDVCDIDLKEDYISISAKNGDGISALKNKLLNFINTEKISENDSIVSNLRHHEQLQLTLHEINTIIHGMENNISGDLLSINIRQALFHLGSITGEITTDDLLGNIFGKFCIGK